MWLENNIHYRDEMRIKASIASTLCKMAIKLITYKPAI